jgi:hypothetical protein
MNLPIRFPNNVEVITEEVARFRTLSDDERVAALGELFRAYHFLAARSESPEEIARFADADEERSRRAIEELVKRHG